MKSVAHSLGMESSLVLELSMMMRRAGEVSFAVRQAASPTAPAPQMPMVE